MKQVICPIDFSDLSKKSLSFAAEFAAKLNFSLLVVHVVHYVTSSDTNGAIENIDIADNYKEEEKQLKHWVEQIAYEYPDLHVNSLIKVGLLSDVIAQIETPNTIVVSGTSGTSDFLSRLLGSVTQELFHQVSSPVIVIPKTYGDFKLTNVCYATDLLHEHQDHLTDVSNWVARFGACMQVLSVMEDLKHIDIEAVGKSFLNQYHKQHTFSNVTFHIKEASSPSKGIRAFVKEHDCDMLVLTHKERDFWSSIFEKSTSGEFIANSEVPVLVFHEK
jgi:universal stress protein A